MTAGTFVGAGDVSVWRFGNTLDTTVNGAFTAAPDGAVTGADEDALLTFEFFDSSVYTSFPAFQGTVVPDVDFDSTGRLHMAEMDIGYARHDPGGRAEVPPQFEVLTKHGRAVDAVPLRAGGGDAVWMTLAAGTAVAVLRSDDNGSSWCYQLGNEGWPTVDDTVRDFIGDHWDLMPPAARAPTYDVAVAFPDWPACDWALWGVGDQGEAFYDASTSGIWGIPTGIAALDEELAVVSFGTSDVTGTLAVTEDGGVNWTKVSGPPAGSCSGADVFTGAQELRIIDRLSYWTSASDWRIEAFFRGDSSLACELWRVAIWPGSTGIESSWTWIDLSTGCPNIANTLGMSVSPWKDEVMVFGDYTRWRAGSPTWGYRTEVRGGACLVAFDGASMVPALQPDMTTGMNEFRIFAMTPHPFIQDTWFVVPHVDVLSASACVSTWDATTGAKDLAFEDLFTQACSSPLPFVLQWSLGGWKRGAIPIEGLPSLKGLDLAVVEDTWSPEVEVTYDTVELAYATGGSGVFRGAAKW